MPYLSPETPRWSPADEEALAAAARGGLLEETHYLDLKEKIPAGKSENRELARDLASFAVHGGTLLVGLREHDDGHPELVPVELAGLPERIEQIARTIPDPPIPVRCTVIPAAQQPGHGYLVVEVPATGTAPHMVAGVYMGRGDKTKIRLSDAEVLRLHQARSRGEDTIAQLVSEYVARDPVSPQSRRQAHLFVVAAPVSPRPEMLLAVRPEERWQPLLHRLLDQGAYATGTLLAEESAYDPDLRSVSAFGRRSDGAALTYNLTEARELDRPHPDRFKEDAVELEVTDDGAVRVLATRLSDEVSGRQHIFEDVPPLLVRRTIGIAALISDLTGYLGPWMLGVAATGIAGLPAFGKGRALASSTGTVGRDQEVYRRYTTASSIELDQTPGAVTERLTGRFLRSIGFENAPTIRRLLADQSDGEE